MKTALESVRQVCLPTERSGRVRASGADFKIALML